MLLEDQNPFNKALAVALLGAPNVGKSSLINQFLGYDLSIVTNKPQTTRNHFHCVFNIGDLIEVVMVDTPGLHHETHEINKRMNGQANEGSEIADINLVLFDLTKDIFKQVDDFIALYKGDLKQSWILFTKSDLVEIPETKIKEIFELVKVKMPYATKYFVISAKQGTNIDLLSKAFADAAQPGPHLYPNGDVSNKNERFFVTEYIREQAFKVLQDEIPYEIAVVIDEYQDMRAKEMDEKISAKISASILVNRPSQRAIVVGSKGSIIKEIGSKARQKIEAMVGGQVMLNLHVKVSPKWFKNNFVLEELGLPRVQGSARVWRKR